jgi:GMP synthase (glutamine-hydrolysing)
MTDPTRPTVVLVTHARPEAPDSASDHLEAMGYALHWVCPALGERLPPIGRNLAAALIYGGDYAPTETRRFPFMADEIDWVGEWLATGRPFLGLGLGAQVLAVQLGARLYSHADGLSEIGYYTIDPTPEGLAVIPRRMAVAQWHYLGFDLPDSTMRLAGSGYFPNQAIRYAENAFGFQFHPELSMRQHEIWLERNIDMTTIPGAQDIFTQRQMADAHHGRMQAWFIDFLEKWVTGKVPGAV